MPFTELALYGQNCSKEKNAFCGYIEVRLFSCMPHFKPSQYIIYHFRFTLLTINDDMSKKLKLIFEEKLRFTNCSRKQFDVQSL